VRDFNDHCITNLRLLQSLTVNYFKNLLPAFVKVMDNSIVAPLSLTVTMARFLRHAVPRHMWRSSNSHSTTFEHGPFSPYSKFVECFKSLFVECEFVRKSLFSEWFIKRVLQKQWQGKHFRLWRSWSSVTHKCSQRKTTSFRFWPFTRHNAADVYFL